MTLAGAGIEGAFESPLATSAFSGATKECPKELYVYVPSRMLRAPRVGLGAKPMKVSINSIASNGLKPTLGGKVWGVAMAPEEFAAWKIGGRQGVDPLLGRFPDRLPFLRFRKDFENGFVVKIKDPCCFKPSNVFWKRWAGQYYSTQPIPPSQIEIQPFPK